MSGFFLLLFSGVRFDEFFLVFIFDKVRVCLPPKGIGLPNDLISYLVELLYPNKLVSLR